jgi:predicted RNase H-like HicB family nuclease
MLSEFIEAARERATHEIIDDTEPYYGEVPELMGVLAVGRTLEDCRRNLKEVVDEWIAIRLLREFPIPPLDGHPIEYQRSRWQL